MVSKLLLLIIAMITLTGCEKEGEYYTNYDDIVSYKDYGGGYQVHLELPTKTSDVDCNWNNVFESLENEDLSLYESEEYLILDEEYIDYIINMNTGFRRLELSLKEHILIDEIPLEIQISYKPEIHSARITMSTEEVYNVRYFPEPLIGVHFTNEAIKDGSNSVYFNTSGELVGEGGEWFLNADRDEYAEYYYEEMMRIIGLGEE